MAEEPEFKKSHPSAPNEILTIDEGHFVSFNPDVSELPFRFLADLIGEDNESEMETAIIQQTVKPHCRVLKGDHRKAFIEAAKLGWPAVEALYHELTPRHRSAWSEDEAA